MSVISVASETQIMTETAIEGFWVYAVPIATFAISNGPSGMPTTSTLFTTSATATTAPNCTTTGRNAVDWHKDGFSNFGNIFGGLFYSVWWILSWAVMLVIALLLVAGMFYLIMTCTSGVASCCGLGFDYLYGRLRGRRGPERDTEGGRADEASTAMQPQENGAPPAYSTILALRVEEDATMAAEVSSHGEGEPEIVEEEERTTENDNETAMASNGNAAVLETRHSDSESDDETVWQADPLYQEARTARPSEDM